MSVTEGLTYIFTKTERFIGDYADLRVGRIFKIIDTGCAPKDPIIWVQALWHNTPRAIYRLIGHECVDQQYDRAKKRWAPPKRRGGRRHGRGGTPSFTGIGSLPGIGPPTKGIGYYGFRAAELSQKIGWQLLIMDVAFETIANWMTTAMQWEGCSSLEPLIFGAGEISETVYGHLSDLDDLDVVSTYATPTVGWGIGGGTVNAATEISCFYSINTKQFLNLPYAPPGGMDLTIARNGVIAAQTLASQVETEDGFAFQAFAHYKDELGIPANFTIAIDLEKSATAGGVIDQSTSIIQVWGDLQPSLIANIAKDPCGSSG